jgi:hypothetical protein
LEVPSNQISNLQNVLMATARNSTSRDLPSSATAWSPVLFLKAISVDPPKKNWEVFCLEFCCFYCTTDRRIGWFLYILGQPVRSLEEGAASEVFAATKGNAGKYYRLDEEDAPSPLVEEENVVEGFYQATSDLLQEKGYPVKIL